MKEKRKFRNSKIAWGQEISKSSNIIDEKVIRQKLEQEKEQKGLNKDAYYRKYISDKIREYVLQGMEKVDAIKRVIEEEPEKVKQFAYLEKAGLDLRVVFYNWTKNNRSQEKNVKIIEDEER